METGHAPEPRVRVTRRLHVEARTPPRFVLDDTAAQDGTSLHAAADCYRRAAQARRERQRLWTRLEADPEMDDARAESVLREIAKLSELELNLAKRGDALREAARNTVRVRTPYRPQTRRSPQVICSQATRHTVRAIRTRSREHQSRRNRSSTGQDLGGGEPPPGLAPLPEASEEASA